MRSRLREKIIDLLRKKKSEEKIHDEKAPPYDLLPLRSTRTRPLKCLGIEEFLVFLYSFEMKNLRTLLNSHTAAKLLGGFLLFSAKFFS